MPDKDKKVRWISVDGEDSDLSNLRDEDAELAKHRIELCEQAVATARAKGDRREVGITLLNLGEAHFYLGQIGRAIEHYKQALSIFREISDRREEANALDHLGTAYAPLKPMERAIEHHEQALAIYHEIGDPTGEVSQLTSLGSFSMASGQAARAIEYFEQALAATRAISDRGKEANALNNLGTAYFGSGQIKLAVEHCEQAIAISREINDRGQEVNALCNMGAYSFCLGQKERAIERYEQALAIAREIGDRGKEVMILAEMGKTYSSLGQVEKAIEITQTAIQVSEESGEPGADDARQRLDRLYTQKSKKTSSIIAIPIGLILTTAVILFRLINSSTENNYYSKADVATAKAILMPAKLATAEQNRYVSIAELYRNVPTNLTGQKDWKQWKNEYIGRYVKGEGKFVSMSIHPQEHKLFFIVTVFGEGTIENTTQVALWVEDARAITLGEREGSFLIDDTQWIYLGSNYAFEGQVSEFSLFDTELVNSGHSDLVIVKGKKIDIRTVEHTATSAPSPTKTPLPTVTPRKLLTDMPKPAATPTGRPSLTATATARPFPQATAIEGKTLKPSLIAVYVPQLNETATTTIWDRTRISCDEKPVNMWGSPGTYLYKSDSSFFTKTLKPGEASPTFGASGPATLSPAGTMTITTKLGTFQATVLSAARDYDITTGRGDFVKGTYRRTEWYVCGYGLIKVTYSIAEVKNPGNYSSSSRGDYDLLSFTPLTTNESHVRYILADMQLGNVVDGYRVNAADEETAEALRRWDAGIRVVNSTRFERGVVNGQWQIVYAGTKNSITGMDVILTSDSRQ